jgi:hypothetical protein
MRFPAAAIAILAACTPLPPEDPDALRAPPAGSVRYATFEGRVPCGDTGGGCQRIKVGLTLHRDAAAGTPTAYVLEWIHVGVDDVRHVASGTWAGRTGTSWDADAQVIELSDGGDHGFARFLSVQERVLLFLEEDLGVRTGDAGFAYALTRMP